MRACPYAPNIICEYKVCSPDCPTYRKALQSTTKYPIPICVSKDPCRYKRQERKTKLPICTLYDKKTGRLVPCSNQLIISYTWLRKHKPTIETLRKMWYKYKKAGVI